MSNQTPSSSEPASRSNRSSRKKKKRLWPKLLPVLILAAGAGGYGYYKNQAYTVCEAEAGTDITPQAFLKKADPEAVFTEKSDAFDTHKPGTYTVYVKSGLFTHKASLIVSDTTAPKGEAKNVQLASGDTCEASAFADAIEDATNVSISYASQPDFSINGEQPVFILLTDEGGNQTTLTATLLIAPVYPEVVCEAGTDTPELGDFTFVPKKAKLLTDLDDIDMTEVGTYPIELKVDGETYTSNLIIRDTTPPQVSVHDLNAFLKGKLEPEDFVDKCSDISEVTQSFRQEPDMNTPGTQTVELVFTDASGNVTTASAKLTLEEDTEAPVIHGVHKIDAIAGESISFRSGVTVTDNAPDDAELSIDSSKVDFNTPGTYTVTYTATDSAGNTATEEAQVVIAASKYDINYLNSLADELLDKLIDDSMTTQQKVDKIYRWVGPNIDYKIMKSAPTWTEAAYEGLVLHAGDCYTYAATAYILLTRAGIDNMIVTKWYGGDSYGGHYWNLINAGDGWYHYDCGIRLYKYTVSELKARSDKYDDSHKYNPDLYPAAVP